MSGAERLNELAQKLSPADLAQVVHLAEYLASRESLAPPGLAWLKQLPPENEALTPRELESIQRSREERAAALPLIPLEALEAEHGLAP